MAKNSFFYFFAFFTLFLCKNSCKATEEIKVYELKKGDFSVKITNYGATVLSVILPDKNGNGRIFFFLAFLCTFSFISSN